MPIDLSGIQNVGEFYSHHYLDAKMTADGGNTRWVRHGNIRHIVYFLIRGTLIHGTPVLLYRDERTKWVYAELWGKNWTGGQLELEYTANQPKEVRYEKAPTAAPAL